MAQHDGVPRVRGPMRLAAPVALAAASLAASALGPAPRSRAPVAIEAPSDGPRAKDPASDGRTSEAGASEAGSTEARTSEDRSSQDPPATAGAAGHRAPVAMPPRVAGLLEAFCVDCHDGPRAKGGFELAAALRAGAIDEAPLRALRRRLARRDMPPADEPERPDAREYAGAVVEIDALVPPVAREVAAVRRLNREQFARSVRDAIGADSLAGLDVAALLPRDEIGEGFDTTADTLALPPIVIEKYFDAAEAIAARAVAPPSRERARAIALSSFERRGQGGDEGGARVLATNGTLLARVEIAHSGRFRLDFEVFAQQAGDEPARMAVEIDGRAVATHEVVAPRATPAAFAWEGDLARGAHVVGVRFLNDFWDPKHPDPARRDRNLALVSARATGPLGPAETTPFQARMTAAAGEGSIPIRLRRVASALGEELFRRPIADDEAKSLASVARSATGKDARFDESLRALVTAALVDPRFLLRTERAGREDETASGGAGGAAAPRRALDGHELAARLSYFLWSSVPDAALRARAADGSLARDEAVLRSEVARMLADPRASSLSERFATQWLGIDGIGTDGLEAKSLDATLYPAVDAPLLKSMRRETELLFGRVVRGELPVRALIESRTTEVDARLARHYGLAPFEPTRSVQGDAASGADAFVERAVPDARGPGVLGHASVLVATSNPTRTSPVKRGKWVLESLLDAAPPPPPPGVPQLPETAEARRGLPMRELMRIHRENPDCATCHVRMDAIGLAFERADADGRLRETVDGAPVDDASVLANGLVLAGFSGIRTLVGEGDRFERSLARHLFVYALGRGTADADDALLDALAARLREDGRFATLVEEIVVSDAFRTRRLR